MMCIGKVLVCVRQRLMAMAVSMRGSWGDGLCVRMLMVLIVGVLMFMLQDLVRMGMPMAIGQVQPNAYRHQSTGNEQGHGYRFARPYERRVGKECVSRYRSWGGLDQ